MNLFDLTGKTSVLFGGNSTLGGQMAVALGAYGARVAVVGRTLETSERVRLRVEEEGGEARVFRADVTKEKDIRRVLQEVLDWTGQVDILVNSAGINSDTSFLDLTMEEWDRIMDVNLKSVVRTCQCFGRQMIDQGEGGSIINISSASSGPPLSKVFTYSAAKAAINNVTQYLAREFAPHGIRVNAVIPGFFPAEQNRALLSSSRVAAIMEHTPMARFGKPEELQGVVVWLASQHASGFVTGALIRVDGGFGAMTI